MYPDECLFIAMDGTDQLPFGYPHFAQASKDDKKKRLTTKLMISYVHGVGVWTYSALDNVRGDPNFNIECLQRTLKKVEERRNGKLPPVLFLHLDNCWRENKNTYVLAFLSSLVERGVFKRIELQFLPVGHTHNVADQVASRYSIACRCTGIFCRSDLHKVLVDAYTPVPTVEHISTVADIKSWMNPSGENDFRRSKIRRAKGVSVPLFFQFSRDAAGVSVVRTKETHEFQNWSDPFCLWANDTSMDLALTDIGSSAIVNIDPAKLKETGEGLESCYPRMNADAIAECRSDFHAISNPIPYPFHWVDGGLFKCELPRDESVDSDSDSDDGVNTDHMDLSNARVLPGLYKSDTAWERGKRRDCKDQIRVRLG
jgi:hypothetical protein